jgi:hypothetical protein
MARSILTLTPTPSALSPCLGGRPAYGGSLTDGCVGIVTLKTGEGKHHSSCTPLTTHQVMIPLQHRPFFHLFVPIIPILDYLQGIRKVLQAHPQHCPSCEELPLKPILQ